MLCVCVRAQSSHYLDTHDGGEAVQRARVQWLGVYMQKCWMHTTPASCLRLRWCGCAWGSLDLTMGAGMRPLVHHARLDYIKWAACKRARNSCHHCASEAC